MAVSPKALITAQQLTNAAATYYTSTNVVTIVDKFTITNTTGGAITLTGFGGNGSSWTHAH